MSHIKLANILLDESRPFYAEPQLYVHAKGKLSRRQDGWHLSGSGTYDFTTFFNALSVKKYDRYTTSCSYVLHLEIEGKATICQTIANAYDYVPRRDGRIFRTDGEGWQVLDIPLVYRSNDILCGFILETISPVILRNSYYYAEVANENIHPVELALSTTTFKKEPYIEHNIELVNRDILGSGEDIAKHFRMYVVDNGKTLDAEKLSDERVTVFPNRNVGGSGGFAYGMLKSLESGDVTNVLLMDDDVEVSPESIIRTYQLLRILNEEYEDAFISGAMMNYAEPDIHWEDIGYMSFSGTCCSYKPVLRMSILHDCVTSEEFRPAEDIYGDLQQKYAAWWYCCIPVRAIQRNGLPLPVFVRFDDVEYGLRCHPKLISMNGICIWHEAFAMRYNAGVERYQTTRNGLLVQSVTGVASLANFETAIKNNVTNELLKFDYADAELVCQGLEDYLEGPDFFLSRDSAEDAFMDANREREHLIPLAQLRQQALDETGIDVDKLCNDEIIRDMPLGKKPHGKPYNVFHTQLFRRSLNGQLFGRLVPFDGPCQVIEALGWAYQPGRLYGADTLLAINIQTASGVIRKRDNMRCREIWKRFNADLDAYRRQKEQLRAAYAGVRDLVTSPEWWKNYLNLG